MCVRVKHQTDYIIDKQQVQPVVSNWFTCMEPKACMKQVAIILHSVIILSWYHRVVNFWVAMYFGGEPEDTISLTNLS